MFMIKIRDKNENLKLRGDIAILIDGLVKIL